jgi:hypothetical protein
MTQCLTCRLVEKDDSLSEKIDLLLANRATYVEISDFIARACTNEDDEPVRISPDAVSNHCRRHIPQRAVQKAKNGVQKAPEALLGVVKPPKGWEPGFTLDGDTGEATSTPQRNDKISDFGDILLEIGLDPEEFEVVGPARVSKWQTFDGDWLTSYRVRVEKRSGTEIDLPALVQEVKSQIRYVEDKTVTARNSERTLVIPFSDAQVGKVGSRGGSQELIERVLEKRDKLADYIAEQNCSEAVFIDGGDIVESFENTAQQGFTNDLSLMQQLDLAGTLEQEFIALLASTHDRVRVAGVPSNHAAWRKGKDVLGRPGDDWGLFLIRQIEKAYSLHQGVYDHVEFLYPDPWKKSINIDVQGIGVGAVHGEESSLAQMETWWAKQVHGASPVAKSDILITAHYHTLGLKPSGRSQVTGKQKYWIATPTLDNGSDWWANKSGSDSDPGLVAFVVDKEIGFDVQSFTVL